MNYLKNIFKGRVSRKQYILSTISMIAILYVLEILLSGTTDSSKIGKAIYEQMRSNATVFCIFGTLSYAFVIYYLSLVVRRLHDAGWSAWWILLGGLTALTICFIPSQGEGGTHGEINLNKKMIDVILNRQNGNHDNKGIAILFVICFCISFISFFFLLSNTNKQYTPDAFKTLILSKYPSGVANDGRRYSDIPADELTRMIVNKLPNGVTEEEVPYRNYLTDNPTRL